MRKTLFPKNRCFECGEYDNNITRDHFIMKCIFPKESKLRSMLPTLPSCEQCNKFFSPIEKRFRNDIAFIATAKYSEGIDSVLRTALSCIKRAGNRRDYLDRIITVPLETRSGIYFGDGKALLIPAEQTRSVLERIAWGLKCYHQGYWQERTYSVDVDFGQGSYIPREFEKATHSGAFRDIFSYLGLVSKNGNKSMWWMWFYMSVYAVVTLSFEPEPAETSCLITPDEFRLTMSSI